MYLCFMFICDIINIRLSESLYQIKGVFNMFNTIINFIEEQIEQLESEGKSKDEVYFGISVLNDEANAKLQSLGWRAIYVEQGIFQLSKL